MLLLFNFYYKQFGIRRIQQLLTPKLFVFNSFPRNTVLHYVSDNPDIHDLDPSKPYFANYNKRILVDYPSTLSSSLGTPKRLAIMIKEQFRKFHLENKKFKFQLEHYKTTNDQLSLLVNNYSYLDVQYRYIDFPMTTYYKFKNKYNTVFSEINKVIENSDRNHFIFIDTPEEFPGYSFLSIYEKLTNISMLKIFNTTNKLFLLELWRWLSKDYNKDTIFNAIDKKNLGKVNIVFNTKDGRSAVLNLGYMYSWIKGNDNLTEFANVAQFNNLIIQKLYLKFIITLQSSVPEELSEQAGQEISQTPRQELPVNNTETIEDKLIHDEEADVEDQASDNTETAAGNDFYAYAKPSVPDQVVKADTDTDGDYNSLANSDINDIMLDVDKELKTLDVITNTKLKNKGLKVDKDGEITEVDIIEESNININDIIYKDKSNEEAMIDIINKNSEFNVISASEYRKLTSEVINYGKKKDPYNTNVTISEKINITQDDIKIDEDKAAMQVSDLVIDKSMTRSTLNSFDKDYINNVFQKDMISMISHVQRTGVIVKNHEIEKDNTILGEYEIHTLKLKPIDGVESTIRFRLPVVTEDGTFKANGNKYVMRKQRIDLPIRKIAPDTVALTSYFGKTFVTTAQKKANSSIEWIFRQIEKATMLEDSNIKKLGPANVYDNNFKAPFIYNAIAKKYKIIETDKYILNFDKNDRYMLFEESFIKSLEEDKYILVGRTKGNYPIFVDFNNIFYIFKQNELIEIGDVYSVLELNALKSPVDFTEMRVFNKTMTVGFILAYYIGISNLFKLLNCKFRILESNRNKNLEAHEYALRFKDKVLIFTRKEKLNSLIIGGLLEYEDIIKNFDFNEFNHKDVYYSLLESKGLTSIYIRELELTNEMFIDPITKSILESMNEPTTFKGLLIKSSEMLLNYNYPDSQDTDYQRIRGYERFSGVVYKELVSSIRQFRNKNISGKSKIDMSPFQIWQVIMKDPANKLVEDINPIQNLKESELVTYVGEGGRAKESINKASRAYHINDVGVISEATVDSSDVGINAYLSADPQFSNLRGVINKNKDLTSSNILSTSALLAPGSTNDD